MLNIALCDDEAVSARAIAERLRRELTEMGQEFDLSVFISSRALAAQLQQGKYFDVLFADIDMPELDGIRLGTIYRSELQDTVLVYISNREDRVFEAFQAKPFRFVRKKRLAELASVLQNVACPSSVFVDAPAKNHWAHAGIDYCVANGYMNGMDETSFVPAGFVTRAQLVTILYRIAGEPEVEFKGTFKDVADGKFYSAAVEWAAANGIVNGVCETSFAPEANITREQVAAILYRYVGSPAVEGELAYRDAFRVSGYAKDAMLWAVNEGIINGVADPKKPTMLEPQASATREQIATIIMRFFEN